MYSFGVVLWECLARKAPWEGMPDVRALYRAVRGGERPPLPENAPPDLAALARACWADDPAARPTLEAVLDALVHGIPVRRAVVHAEGGGGGGQAPARAAGAGGGAAAADDDDDDGDDAASAVDDDY